MRPEGAFDQRLNYNLVSIIYIPDSVVGSGVSSLTDCGCTSRDLRGATDLLYRAVQSAWKGRHEEDEQEVLAAADQDRQRR